MGKAKSLRVRLSQYRLAGRGEKMRRLVKKAFRLTWELCESELQACLREVELIQINRPPQNIASAYSFMYPLVGTRIEAGALWFCFTTVPAELPQYQFHGSFRSREVTATAFFALVRLLKYLGHPEKLSGEIPSYSYCMGFRRVPAMIASELQELLSGKSPQLLTTLFTRLLEHAGARAKASEVKEDLRSLRTFYETEAVPLRLVIEATGFEAYPVLQQQRDPLFLKAKLARP